MSKDLVWVYSVPNHLQLKEYILSSIDQYDQVGECPDPVTKTDFYDYTFESGLPDYFPYLADSLDDLWKLICNKYWASTLDISKVWFQQYTTNDFHGWHFHGQSSISLSYMLELNDPRYSTEFIDTERNEVFQLDVDEGDILVFPSYIIHRSPLLKSDRRKTSVAINVNLGDVDLNLTKPIDPIYNYE